MTRRLIILFLFTHALAVNSVSAQSCLESIPGIFIYDKYADYFKSSEGLCQSCSSEKDKIKRTACMQRGLLNGWELSKDKKTPSLRERYNTALSDWVRDSIQSTVGLTSDGTIYKPSADEVLQKTNKLIQECPGLAFGEFTGVASRMARNNYSKAQNCVVAHFCLPKPPPDQKDCSDPINIASIGIIELAMEHVQSKAAMEAIYKGKSLNDEEWDFTDELGSKPAPPPPPFKPKGKALHGYSSQAQYVQTIRGNPNKMGQLDEAMQEAVEHKIGCSTSDGSRVNEAGICITTGYENVPSVVLKTVDDMNAIMAKLVYRDLTQFAAKKVWESYTVALLADPFVTGGQCQDEKYMLENIKFQIGTDLRGEAGGSVEANLELLNQCFDGNSKDFNRPLNQLGMDNRVQSLAQTATNLRNLKCQNKKLEVSTDSCAKQSELDDKGASDKRDKDILLKRVADLKLLEERRELLNKGKFEIAGKPVTCGEYKTDCDKFFKEMEKCAPEFSVSQGCLHPDNYTDGRAAAWLAYNNLKETENYILTKYPELAQQMKTVNDERKPAWKLIHENSVAARDSKGLCPFNGKKIACSAVADEQILTASRMARRKKLDLIVNEMCDDPEDFAKKMLLTNPKLVNEYMEQSKSPELAGLLCIGLTRAKQDEKFKNNMKVLATEVTLAVGAASAIPTGGSSMALALAIASGTMAVGMTAYDLQEHYSKMKLEVGLHSACIGDYRKAKEATDTLEDAMIRAAIDLGVGVGMFAGMSAVAKVKKLREFAKQARSVENSAPSWAASVERSALLSVEVTKAQRGAVAAEYALAEVPGMTKAGKLTAQGEKMADDIRRLEVMGVPKNTIRQSIKGCPL